MPCRFCRQLQRNSTGMILLISQKNTYATKRLIEESINGNCAIEVFSAEELAEKNFEIDISKFDIIYVRNPFVKGSPKYFPQIINLAKKFKSAGKKVVDEVIAEGELAQGKWLSYEKLQKAKLPIPETKLLKNFQFPISNFKYPLIVKWIYGFRGNGTFLVRKELDFKKIPPHIPKEELILQEFISAEYEYKIITIGYKSLPVVLRFRIQDLGFKIDYSKYEVLDASNATKVVDLAEKASNVLKRELAKVDILESKGKFYILEVNRNPGLESFEKLTGYNVANEFIKYLARPIER